MPTRPRGGRAGGWDATAALGDTGETVVITCAPHSYCQSGSSGCLRSHSGRRLRTTGKVSKLYSGGGDVVDHSRVHASHGSLPAGVPTRSERSRLTAKTPTAVAWKTAPTDAARV